ncbi:MAG: hypothetical protein ABSE62_15050 [Chthoniobacteraceae bacterium]|jgi:uncharacterized membrane protein YphA (DoxX/SURF4 family)
MKILLIIARLLLGLAFVVFGLNAFFQFMKMGPMPKGPAGAFIGAMFQSGYFYAVAVVQIVSGLLLLSGKFVALGLTLLGPVIFNILCYHIFFEPTGIQLGIIVFCLEAFLIWGHRDRFAPLFKP